MMSVFLSVTVQVKNFDMLKAYMSKVPQTMEPHGAELVYRGQVTEILHGSLGHQMEATFKFPSIESVHAWYESPDYQALVPSREAAAHMNIAILNPF